MSIDYLGTSEMYRPEKIRTLLVGESPPPSGKVYFYHPRVMSVTKPLALDSSLPATIFGHYFQRRPATVEEYIEFLHTLQKMGVFLIDICVEPIKVRNDPAGVERMKKEIPLLRSKIRARGIAVEDPSIIFLLARGDYLKNIRNEFPESRYIRWKDFRLETEKPFCS